MDLAMTTFMRCSRWVRTPILPPTSISMSSSRFRWTVGCGVVPASQARRRSRSPMGRSIWLARRRQPCGRGRGGRIAAGALRAGQIWLGRDLPGYMAPAEPWRERVIRSHGEHPGTHPAQRERRDPRPLRRSGPPHPAPRNAPRPRHPRTRPGAHLHRSLGTGRAQRRRCPPRLRPHRAGSRRQHHQPRAVHLGPALPEDAGRRQRAVRGARGPVVGPLPQLQRRERGHGPAPAGRLDPRRRQAPRPRHGRLPHQRRPAAPRAANPSHAAVPARQPRRTAQAPGRRPHSGRRPTRRATPRSVEPLPPRRRPGVRPLLARAAQRADASHPAVGGDCAPRRKSQPTPCGLPLLPAGGCAHRGAASRHQPLRHVRWGDGAGTAGGHLPRPPAASGGVPAPRERRAPGGGPADLPPLHRPRADRGTPPTSRIWPRASPIATVWASTPAACWSWRPWVDAGKPAAWATKSWWCSTAPDTSGATAPATSCLSAFQTLGPTGASVRRRSCRRSGLRRRGRRACRGAPCGPGRARPRGHRRCPPGTSAAWCPE